MLTRLVGRFLTIAVIVCLCSFTAAGGWSIVAFETADRTNGPDRAAVLRAWFETPLVAGAALQASLDDLAGANDADAARQRVELLIQILAIRPLSSVAWLSLAGMRAVTAAPQDEVLSALKMSAVTGPNEGKVMWQRGAFGLLKWEALPPEFKQQAVHDLAAPIADGMIDDGDVRLVKGVLDNKPMTVRSELAALLRDQGIDTVRLQRIGLAVPAQ